MIRFLKVSAIILFFVRNGFSQELDFRFNLRDTSVQCYVLGENHLKDNFSQKFLLIKELLKENEGVFRIGIELPVGNDYFINQYFIKNQINDLEIAYSKIDRKIYEEHKKIIDTLRTLQFKTTSGQSRIEFFTFDIPSHVLNTTQLILEQKCKGILEVLPFLETLRLKNHNLSYFQTIYLVEEIVKEFRENESMYRKLLNFRYEDIETIINGMEIAFNSSYNRGSDEYFRQRELYLIKQVEKEFSKGQKMLLLVGNAHADLLSDDDYFNIKTLASVITQNHPGKVYTIFTQYVERRRLVPSFRLEDLLSINPRKEFKLFGTRYKFFKGEELQKHPEAAKRCNALLLYDTRFIRF